jgi:hypothetical protein
MEAIGKRIGQRLSLVRTVGLIALCAAPLCADFSYNETSQITGGALLGMVRFAGAFSKDGKKLTQPIESTTAVKGNRMVRKTADQATIIDLDQQTITTIHLADKTYSVMTFDEMKQRMKEASEKMRSKQGGDGNVSFDVNVKETGQKKTINGQETHEMIMTLTMSGTDAKSGQQGAMNVVSDSWIAPDIAGYSEVVEFHKRMADSLGWVPGGNPLINRPDMAKGMAELYKQAGKLNGMPMTTTVKMGAAGQGGEAASAQTAPTESNSEQQQAKSSPPPSSVSDALGGMLGGRFGRRKKSNPSEDGQGTGAGSGGDPSGALLEMTSQVSSYHANAVEASQFETPAGFTKVAEETGGPKRH